MSQRVSGRIFAATAIALLSIAGCDSKSSSPAGADAGKPAPPPATRPGDAPGSGTATAAGATTRPGATDAPASGAPAAAPGAVKGPGLAGLVPGLGGASERARRTKAMVDITQLSSGLEVFRLDLNRYPTTEEGLAALAGGFQAVPGGRKQGPYVPAVPNDPWGHPYVYHYPGTHNPNGFDLSSPGPDGTDGTADDIGNWGAK